ncbi:MAG: hypothetical protein ACRD3E_01850 [Terriglobales bacterium]
MRKVLLPLAGVALLAGFGAVGAAEPTTATGPTALDAKSMDSITAGWRDDQGDRTYQSQSSFLSPQVNVAALNNINVVSLFSNQISSVAQANSNGNSNSR